MQWTKKYQPKNSGELVGHETAINKLKTNIKLNKPTLIYGNTGTGKTSSVYAIANELNYEVLEINASDLRNKDQIENIIANAIKQVSLFKKGKIILIDEVDGINKLDYGGLPMLISLLNIKKPIVFTANNIWDSKLSSLRNKTDKIEFKSLNYLAVFNVLKKICETEKVKYEEPLLKTLARTSMGDLRAAINDLQALSEHSKELKDLHCLGERKKEESIFNILQLILKTKDPKISMSSVNDTNLDLKEIILWIEENIPKEYKKPEELVKAYDALSKADVYLKRIIRRQHWRFLVYVKSLATAGVSLAKKEKYLGFTKYQKTKRILKIWQANRLFAKRKEIAQKLAKITHSSTKNIIKSWYLYHNILKEESIQKYLNLEQEELDFIKN